jgi:hypothetical protein
VKETDEKGQREIYSVKETEEKRQKERGRETDTEERDRVGEAEGGEQIEGRIEMERRKKRGKGETEGRDIGGETVRKIQREIDRGKEIERKR